MFGKAVEAAIKHGGQKASCRRFRKLHRRPPPSWRLEPQTVPVDLRDRSIPKHDRGRHQRVRIVPSSPVSNDASTTILLQ